VGSGRQSIGELLKEKEYKVEYTPKTADGGVDLYIKKGKPKAAVQCKRYKTRVAAGHMREFVGAMNDKGYEEGFFIATKGVTEPAMKLAKSNNIKVVTLKEIIDLTDGRRKAL
jgi:restriction system protein